MEAIAEYDSCQVCWRVIRPIVEQINDHDCPMDLTDGELVAWWVWLSRLDRTSRLAANTGSINPLFLVSVNREKLILIDGEAGKFKIGDNGRMHEITEAVFKALLQ